MVTVQFVRRRKLREEYALLWLAASGAILLLSVFGGISLFLAALFGVSYPPTLVLVFGLLFALAILMSHSVVMTGLTDRVRDLAQAVTLLEWQVRQVQARVLGEDVDLPGEEGLAVESAEEAEQRRRIVLPRPALSSHSSGRGRVLVVGLDGATFDLIRPWAADGALPALARILEGGAHGPLRSTIPPMTAPAWTSFATGTNPGRHGLYDWIARREGSYRFAPVTALDCAAPTIYSLLSEAGRRVCVLNVPMTYPPTPVNGALVSGMPAPSTAVPITYPRGLYDEIVQEVGDYILYPDPGQAYSDSGVDAFLERLHRAAHLRGRTFDYLREREDWDFAMVVFNGTDTVGHAMWRYMDPAHPRHDPAKRARYGDAIRDYYRQVDGYLGHLLETLDEDTTLIIMSDHGLGPFHKFIHVNNWLMESGLLQVRSSWNARAKAALFRHGLTPMNAYDLMMRLGLGGLKREVVRGQGQGLMKALFLSLEDVDWSRTVAYSVGNVGQVNINLAGREPQGCVAPGEEYERVRDDVIARLGQLRDPDTGEEVVEAVYRREEIYAGHRADRAPDILFIPRRLEYFGFGEYEFGSNRTIDPVRHGISGTHRMDGVFLAFGRGIRAGARIEGARIVDLAPTIMHLMGEPVPGHMDGQVLRDAITEGFQPQPVPAERVEWRPEAQEGQAGSEGTLTEEEEQALAERLRNLGYVG